jgi:hypothetical protein
LSLRELMASVNREQSRECFLIHAELVRELARFGERRVSGVEAILDALR